jgi:hypothetical protein
VHLGSPEEESAEAAGGLCLEGRIKSSGAVHEVFLDVPDATNIKEENKTALCAIDCRGNWTSETANLWFRPL